MISCYISFQDPKLNVVSCYNFARPVWNQKLWGWFGLQENNVHTELCEKRLLGIKIYMEEAHIIVISPESIRKQTQWCMPTVYTFCYDTVPSGQLIHSSRRELSLASAGPRFTTHSAVFLLVYLHAHLSLTFSHLLQKLVKHELFDVWKVSENEQVLTKNCRLNVIPICMKPACLKRLSLLFATVQTKYEEL